MLLLKQCKFAHQNLVSEQVFCYDVYMNWIIAALGNPGEEYAGTRHNVGRDLLMAIEKKEGDSDTKPGKANRLFGKKVVLLYPNVYMNNSGGPIKKAVPTKKAAEGLIVLHDELDLPLGKVKLSFGSSAGGHNGVKSVQNALKTQDFIRIRVGISGSTPSGKLKRPKPEKLGDFVLNTFTPKEKLELKKVQKIVSEALELIVTEGFAKAQAEIHSR
jgi:peptidyl-tRNA hydrolase, PTH1 family